MRDAGVKRCADTVHEAAQSEPGNDGQANAASGFLDEIDRIVPWADLVARVSPYLDELQHVNLWLMRRKLLRNECISTSARAFSPSSLACGMVGAN